MRIALSAAAMLIAASSFDGAAAVEYPWCAYYGDSHGGVNCGFVTLEQCRATISGNGGTCQMNPFYAWSNQQSPGSRRPRRPQ